MIFDDPAELERGNVQSFVPLNFTVFIHSFDFCLFDLYTLVDLETLILAYMYPAVFAVLNLVRISKNSK